MPKRGRAAHGGGAAKWRHGWIPANAAARAIVRARQERVNEPKPWGPKLSKHEAKAFAAAFAAIRGLPGEESSSPVTGGHYRIEKQPDGQWGIVLPDGRFFPTADRLQARAILDRFRKARPELVQTELRAPDVESGTMSLFRGRRDIIEHTPPAFLTELPKIEGKHTSDEDVINTNPHYFTTIKAQAVGYEPPEVVLARELKPYHINCYNCVQSYELRRRGYAVTAAPASATDTILNQGQSDGQIADGWLTPAGHGAQFESVLDSYDKNGNRAYGTGIRHAMANWPVGARGWVTNAWKDGGGHVFVVEKVDGPTASSRIKVYDPQPGEEVSLEDYSRRSRAGSMKILRTDNLIPTDSIENVVEGPGLTKGTWRPDTKTMDTRVRDMPGVDSWIQSELKATLDRYHSLPEGSQEREDAHDRYFVLKNADQYNPTGLLRKISDLDEEMSDLQHNIDAERHEQQTLHTNLAEYIRRDENELHLLRIYRQAYQEVLDWAVPDHHFDGPLLSGPPAPHEGLSFPRIGGSHDWKADLSAANPDFSRVAPNAPANAQWRTNCISAVAAFDLRRRGYAVKAVPSGDRQIGFQVGQLNDLYRGSDGKAPEMTLMSISDIHRKVDAWPDGAWGWTMGAGHMFVIQKQGGHVYYLDPQAGNIVQQDDGVVPYWYSDMPGTVDKTLVRLDDLTPVPDDGWLVQAEKGAAA